MAGKVAVPVAATAARDGGSGMLLALALMAAGGIVLAVAGGLALAGPRQVTYTYSRPPPPPPLLPPPVAGLSAAEQTALRLSLWQTRDQLREATEKLEALAVELATAGGARAGGNVEPVELLGGPGGLRVGGEVERRAGLSYAEFQSQYAAVGRPVIITDQQDVVIGAQHGDPAAAPWTAEWISRRCGAREAPLFRRLKKAASWANLVEVEPSVQVGRFIADHTSTPAGPLRGGYLHDWSLAAFCPEALANLSIPKYFAGDYLQVFLMASSHTPSEEFQLKLDATLC